MKLSRKVGCKAFPKNIDRLCFSKTTTMSLLPVRIPLLAAFVLLTMSPIAHAMCDSYCRNPCSQVYLCNRKAAASLSFADKPPVPVCPSVRHS
jgi:hypothetical protein